VASQKKTDQASLSSWTGCGCTVTVVSGQMNIS
jgi:hypothetical protein